MDNSTGTYKLVGLELDRVDLVTAGANPGAHILIHKFAAPDIVEENPVADTVETVEAPEAPVQEVAMSEETPVETVAKADFDTLQKSLDAEVAKAAELAERVEKMERERKQAEFVAKAAEFSNLGKADEIGALLLAASESFSAEQYQMLERLFKATNAQVDKGALFAQFSQPEGDNPEVGDRITDLAKAKVAAGTAKTLEIAKLQVMQENTELQSEYMSARDSAR